MTNSRQDTLYRKIDREKMPVPSTGVFDSPYYIKRINIEWYKHISGIVSGLYEISAWSGTDEEIKRAIDEIHAWLSESVNVIENCEDVNDCLSDDSPIMQAIAENNQNAYKAQAQNMAQDRVNKYYLSSESLQIYNPSLGNSWLQSESDSDKATLCAGVYYWLYVIRENLNTYGNAAINGLYAIQTGAAIAGAASTVTGVGAVASAVVGIGAGFTVSQIQEQIDAFNNQDAFDEVACLMQNEIANRPLKRESYFNALNAAESAVTLPDSAKIVDHIQHYYGDSALTTFDKDSAFLWFADCVASANNTYQPPVGSSCECIVLDDCTTGTNTYYPSTGYLTIPSDTFELLSGAYYSQTSTGKQSIRINPSGGKIKINLPERYCTQYLRFNMALRNISGGASGAMKLTLYTDTLTGETKSFGVGTSGNFTIHTDINPARLFITTTSLILEYGADTGGYGYTFEMWEPSIWIKQDI